MSTKPAAGQCVLPRVSERIREERPGLGGEILTCVTVRTAIDLVSVEDGTCHTIEAFGEAFDASDKATAKAMTSAYKYALIEAFCIPVVGADDPERIAPRLTTHIQAPPEGWESWAYSLAASIATCDSARSINGLQERHRAMLHALSRERPDLYASLGEDVIVRRASIMARAKRSHRRPLPRNPDDHPAHRPKIPVNETTVGKHV